MSEQLAERDRPGPPPKPTRGQPRFFFTWRPRISRWDVPAAAVTWFVTLIAGELLVRRADLNPFTVAGAVMPVAVGAIVAVLLVVVILRRPSSAVLVGVATGAYAGWLALVMAQALHGTPFGYDGMAGDEHRLVAQAMKYMTSWRATDAYVHDLPTEYPPLFPWIVGHVAAVIHRPAWRVIGDAQVVLMSFALVLGYTIWRRLVGPVAALMIVVLAPLIPTGEHFGDASKAYEFVVLIVIVPWILQTFAGLARERGGLHWLPAGVIGGLIVLTYPAYFVFALFGVIAIIVLGWRGTQERQRYVLHLVGVAATATVVASWYVVPFVVRSLTHGGNRLSDLYRAPSIVASPVPLPFLEPTLIGLISLVGLIGLVWYRRSEWWAQPMLLLVLSTYAYRLLFLLVTAFNGHTGYLEYTDRLTSALLIAAGVMTVSCAVPRLRAGAVATSLRRRELAALTGVAIVGWAAMQTWALLTPGPRGLLDANSTVGTQNWATAAHLSPLPDGSFPRFAPADLVSHRPHFPVDQIQQEIEATLGSGARPESLSYSDLLYAYLPYYAYLPGSRLAANTLQRWEDRFASLEELAQVTDPVAFANRSAHLPFGRIDVFVLRQRHGRWLWIGYSSPVGDQPHFVRLTFSPQSFSPRTFVVSHLPSNTVVAIRRPG